jgi:hypothetical protein
MVSLVDGATALAVGIGSAVMKPVRPDVGPLTHRWGLGFGDFAANLPCPRYRPWPVHWPATSTGSVRWCSARASSSSTAARCPGTG